MVHFCAMPHCSNESNKDHKFTSHQMPLNKEKELKELVHKIGRMSLPLNDCTLICSKKLVKFWAASQVLYWVSVSPGRWEWTWVGIPQQAFFQGWLLPLLLTSGALSDPVLFNTEILGINAETWRCTYTHDKYTYVYSMNSSYLTRATQISCLTAYGTSMTWTRATQWSSTVNIKYINLSTNLTYVILDSLLEELKIVMNKLCGSERECVELEKVYCG